MTRHPSHEWAPIDPIEDPALMCRICDACACCEPAVAATVCPGEREWIDEEVPRP